MSGKGDGYRPVDRDKFSKNWVRIFANKQDRETDSAVLQPQSLRQKDCVKHSKDEDVTTPKRCPDTIDIEEQIEQDREAD